MEKLKVAEQFVRAPYARMRPARTGRFDRLSPEEFDIRREGGRRIHGSPDKRSDGPLVSVITACRNAESTIQTAIDSVKAQTYGNVEHIIVDGVSTDATLDIIESNRDAIAYFVSAPDNGTYSAMNRGLSLAKGDYIAILNADDRLMPEFVEKSLKAIEASGADISYCDYHTEDKSVKCPDLNYGLLFTQLDIKHNTFLFAKACFESVGEFDDAYKVAADAKWNRAAYLRGLQFVRIPEELVFYSTLGVSSAQTDEIKEAIIRQSARLITECFGFLDQREARHLYTSNFNTHSLNEVQRLYERYADHHPLFRRALTEFIRFNLERKDAYRVNSTEARNCVRVIDLCDALRLPLSSIQFAEAEDPIEPALAAMERIGTGLAQDPKTCVLHFARKFSSPSEPFIPNMMNELARREPDRRHVMLCDERLLAEERPFDDAICIPWNDLDGLVRERLYDIMWSRLQPKLIVAHFALNGYWLFQRLKDERRYTPTINICHGIDVFAITPGNDYYQYIQEYAAISPRVCFAPVSNYLMGLLIDAGVPEEKVFRVNNSITEGFARARKASDFYRGDRPLRILCVGRLIKWKGHHILLRALAAAKDKMPAGFRLQIVYGNWEEELDNLKALASQLGIAESVEFEPFVDFEAETGYFSRFDLFALPSTLSEDETPRTETFGVALLEAIAAGLPVITTTAGGLPEVAGAPNDHAMIAKYGDEQSLYEAFAFALDNCDRVFSDNSAYARERLEEFSPANQYQRFKQAEAWLNQPRPRVYHFSSLTRGGAAGATINIHKGLCKFGYDSIFVTRGNQSPSPYLPNVIKLSPELAFDFDHAQVKDSIKHRHTVFSIDDTIISNETITELVADADIINFAWCTQFISSDNIAAVSRMGKPVVITVRDMNPITGGCHFFHGCEEWRRECDACPQLTDNEDNFPHLVWRNKRETWNFDALTFIALSEHSRSILNHAGVSQGARIERVSNPLDESVFHLEDKREARAHFGFDADAFLIGYLPSFNSLVKGHDELVAALSRLKEWRPEANVAVALAADAALGETALSFDVLQIGAIKDVDEMRKFYNAVDVVAVPSLEETFSNTTVEAIACGAPVVGFETGVLAELLTDKKLGSASPVGDIDSLAQGIAHFIDSEIDRKYCSRTIHEKFSSAGQIEQYDVLFRELMASPPTRVPFSAEHADLATALSHRRSIRKAQGAKRRLSGVSRRMRGVSQENRELKRIIEGMMLGGAARREARKQAEKFTSKRPRVANSRISLDPYDDSWLASHRTPLDLLTKGVPHAAQKLLNGGRSRYYGISKSSVPRDIPTPPNFDESAYLRSHPDVRHSIETGAMPSAYYHFIRFGRFEGRMRPNKAS